jgi:hypothetical protein
MVAVHSNSLMRVNSNYVQAKVLSEHDRQSSAVKLDLSVEPANCVPKQPWIAFNQSCAFIRYHRSQDNILLSQHYTIIAKLATQN